MSFLYQLQCSRTQWTRILVFEIFSSTNTCNTVIYVCMRIYTRSSAAPPPPLLPPLFQTTLLWRSLRLAVSTPPSLCVRELTPRHINIEHWGAGSSSKRVKATNCRISLWFSRSPTVPATGRLSSSISVCAWVCLCMCVLACVCLLVCLRVIDTKHGTCTLHIA